MQKSFNCVLIFACLFFVLPSFNAQTYPYSQLNTYLIEPYWLATNPNKQQVNHHFCSTHQPTGIVQCALFDSSDPSTARLVGIEYAASEEIFNTFDDDEKKLWHSHAYPVQSGNLIAPELYGENRTNALDGVAKSYGKAIFLWVNDLPVGMPVPVYSFIADGQIASDTIEEENEETSSTPQERKEWNSNVEIPCVAQGADQWYETGEVPVFHTCEKPLPSSFWN